ncbi:hypothetical protein [Rubrivirga sp.]|uniref:hypothetical protein n=1 Tax=Rubrivirga sp. TaxID=1885344 RepID=UPI003B51D3AD
MGRRLLLLALAVGACQGEPPTPAGDVSPGPAPETTRAVRPPPTPFDAAEVVFDTTEPPETVVQIPPRPAPPPRPPLPRPAPAPSPGPPSGASGRCDVRATESYCFAYTGEAWTPESARAQCDAAPDAAFAPGACPTEGRIATCTFERESAPGRELVYTYYAPYDPALAALACPGLFARIE